MTVAVLLATLSIVRQMRSISGSRVIRPASASGWCSSRRRRFSFCSSNMRNARSTVRLSSSGSKGLAKKS